MRAPILRHAVVGFIAVMALGCPAPPQFADADAAGGPPDPWYRRSTALDLTGDGQLDSVRLEAHGARPDSLQVALVLLVEGEEKYREEWGSSYELALVDSVVLTRPRLDEFMRARLDTVLARVEVERLDSPSVQLMAEDRSILARLVPRPEHRISMSYGYETTVRLVWDSPRNRFVRLWSCC